MANYPAPTELLPVFSPSVFQTNDIPLTIEEGSKYFLNYPVAQGAETIASLSTGTLSVSGTLNTTNSSTFGTNYGYQTTIPSAGTSIHNTAYGYQAATTLSATTGTGGNTAFGAIVMPSITGAAANNTAIGHNALWSLTTGIRNTCVGAATQTTSITTGIDNTTLGFNAKVGTANNGAVAVGYNASSTGASSISIGDSSTASGTSSISIGDSSTASGTSSIAIGDSSTTAGFTNSVALGVLATATAANQIVLGTTSETIRYNKVSPLYTTIPTYATNDIGYQYSGTITFSNTGTYPTIISVPVTYAGLYCINLSGWTNLSITGTAFVWINTAGGAPASGYTFQYAFANQSSTYGAGGLIMCCSVILRVTGATPTIAVNLSNTLTGFTSWQTGTNFYTITRIA